MKICLIAILFITMTLSILYLTDTVFADNILAEDTNEAADSFSASESTVQLKSFSYKKVAATAAKNICAHTGISLSASEAYIPAPSFMAVSVASGESDAEDGMSDSEAHRIMLSFGSALPISCEIACREKYIEIFSDDAAVDADNRGAEQDEPVKMTENSETDPVAAAIAAVAEAKDGWREDIIFSHDYTSERGIDTMTVTLYRHESGETITLSLADYVTGIVAAEMPSYFDYEARCAQAISARTFVLYKMDNGGIAAEHPDVRLCDGAVHCCAYVTRDDLVDCWGNAASADKAYAAAAEAVAATSDTVVLYGGEAICAVWHSRSNAATVSAESVWGYHIPYLLGAPSPEDGGYRYGHGVGLSQYGAEAMAQLGYSAAEIVSNYYADCEIVKLSAR